VEKNGTLCIALRLRPLVQMLNNAGVGADEKKIRNEFNKTYGKSFVGNQHFLDATRSSPMPIRNKSYCNTKHAKCIFIPSSDVGHPISDMLLSAAGS